jgi:outer membrane protein
MTARGAASVAIGMGAAALAAAGAARASDWTVTVGARAQAVVPYEGAGHDDFVPVPSIQVRRPGDPDRPTFPGDSLGVALLRFGPLSLGPGARLRGNRNDKGERAGLDKVHTAVELGGFANLWLTEWLRLHVDGGRGVTGHSGWVADGAADLVVRPGRWILTAGPRIGWGNAGYMDKYFGLTAREAAANAAVASIGGTAYEPGSGRRYVGALATAAYRISPRWQATANVAFHRLSGKAADSPIVRAIGSADEYSGGVGVRYSFGWSP